MAISHTLSLSLSLMSRLCPSWIPHWGERKQEWLQPLLAATFFFPLLRSTLPLVMHTHMHATHTHKHSQYSCVNGFVPQPVGKMFPQTCLCDKAILVPADGMQAAGVFVCVFPCVCDKQHIWKWDMVSRMDMSQQGADGPFITAK